MSGYGGVNGFFAIANRDRLVLVNGDTNFVLNSPYLTQWDIKLDNPPARYSDSRGGIYHVACPPSITATLEFVCHSADQGLPELASLRFADDMTVRELLGTIDRKLRMREP